MQFGSAVDGALTAAAAMRPSGGSLDEGAERFERWMNARIATAGSVSTDLLVCACYCVSVFGLASGSLG